MFRYTTRVQLLMDVLNDMKSNRFVRAQVTNRDDRGRFLYNFNFRTTSLNNFLNIFYKTARLVKLNKEMVQLLFKRTVTFIFFILFPIRL